MLGLTMIVYIDYVLLAILLALALLGAAWCARRLWLLRRDGQVTDPCPAPREGRRMLMVRAPLSQVEALLKPTRVLFSHKTEGGGIQEMRTVVAYQNPFTGDYCVRKERVPRVYENGLAHSAHLAHSALPAHSAQSPDSGLSDEYEPLRLDPLETDSPRDFADHLLTIPPEGQKASQLGSYTDNRLSHTWNWNYKEYQI